ncbi:uncharacterized protein M437DRAFT_67915 [Aureobasidium melanogenum CBS 110374]|uniref:Uncharacterized protein n=1 Tax=Aureobasidium melanogenum (strain CBS 110374) TaxID=1043003 RepID=A0A074VNR8_AURM1|nr:uncharacterized protein M437DRAFT_67915 [Aureobasidium melanogenum CBS 110374]KEQ60749.1 hypothetical protein M437DRAFT_67915 [Aureobasidium melanogenum CBS 110374]
MAVQDPQCCGLNGRSLKGNRGLRPLGGKAMLDVHQTFQNQAGHSDSRGQASARGLQYEDEFMSAHRDGLAGQTDATHFSAPVVAFTKESCVRVRRDGRPCYVVIMHSTHKLTPEVHITHQRRLEAGESWFLLILHIMSNLNPVWLLPPTQICGPLSNSGLWTPVKITAPEVDQLAR